MIEFSDDKGVLGTVTLDDDGKLLASNTSVTEYVDRWTAKDHSVDDFEDFYDGWSNGYVSARRITDVNAELGD